MRKWMLITVLAMGLCLCMLPGLARAELMVTVKQHQPYAHGTLVFLSVGVETTENSIYFIVLTADKPNGQSDTFYHTGASLLAKPISWKITNGTEASQIISITTKVYDENDHSKLIYSDTKSFQIQIDHTPLTDWEVNVSPTCEATGTSVKRCDICKAIVETETIPAIGHVYSTITTPGTCITRSVIREVCSACGDVKSTQSGDYGPHTPGAYAVTTPATCVKEGTETQSCSVCDKVLDTRSIPATGLHTPGAYAVTTPVTCGAEGMETQSCTVCGKALNTRPIPATGLHTPNGVWTHTAGTAGAGSRHAEACSVCGAALEEDCVFQSVVTLPACKEAGYTTYTCTLCGFTYTGSPAPAAGHTPGEWVMVKEATNKKEGLSELRCTVCGEVIESREIKRKSEWWRDNTACALGVRLRDEKPELTDKWYMLALVDLTKEGVQEFPLIASNAYVIGTVYVTVDKGNVSVRYELGTKETAVREEYIAWFSGIDDIQTAEMEESSSQTSDISQPVSMAERFPGADSAYLLFRLKLDYDIYADGVKRFYEGQYR